MKTRVTAGWTTTWQTIRLLQNLPQSPNFRVGMVFNRILSNMITPERVYIRTYTKKHNI